MGMDQISESNELERRNIALARCLIYQHQEKKHGDSNSVSGDGESSRWYPPMRTDQRAIQHRDKIQSGCEKQREKDREREGGISKVGDTEKPGGGE